MGTLPGTLAERMLRAVGAEVRTYDGGQEDPYRDLALGRTDAVLLDAPVALYYGERPELTTLPAGFGEIRYVAARASDGRLRDAVDTAIASLVQDGTLPSLLQRWGLWSDEAAAMSWAWRARRPGRRGSSRPGGIGSGKGWWSGGTGPVLLALGREARSSPCSSGVSAMGLAMLLGAALALARVYGPSPVAALTAGYVELFRGDAAAAAAHRRLLRASGDWRAAEPLRRRLARPRAELRRGRGGERLCRAAGGPSRADGRGPCAGPRAVAGGPSRHRPAGAPGGAAAGHQRLHCPAEGQLSGLGGDATELTKTYGTLAAATRDYLGLGLLVGAVYLLLGLPFARLSRWLERRLSAHLEVAR